MRIKMAQNARRTVEEKFTWEAITAKFERIYSKFPSYPPATQLGWEVGNHNPPSLQM